MHKLGDIVRVKITGENAIVIELLQDGVVVRRGVKDGQYANTILYDYEVETVHESIQREFNEAVYRHKLAMSQMDAVEAVEVSAKEGPVQ